MSVSGLPSDGSTIYVRLWSKIGSTWYYNDYTYKAHTGTAQKAEMTSPSPGSTLSGTTVTFQWTNAGADQYWIYAGSASGEGNYVSRNAGTSTSMSVSGLPSDGSTVYVRLWTKINSTWFYNDYTYTAHTGTTQKAEMVSPTQGSTLSGTTVTFQWTNVSAEQYWIYAGSTSGSSNYLSQNAGTSTSMSVSGLPSNGSTVYVRLWTRIGSTWYHNDYTYTASGGSTGVQGTWQVSENYGSYGSFSAEWRIVQSGSSLTVQATRPDGSTSSGTGTISGNNITLSYPMFGTFSGNYYEFSGTVSGNSMSGNVVYGGNINGTWNASKETSAIKVNSPKSQAGNADSNLNPE